LYAVDPWGSERDNLHVAMQLSQTANMNRGKGQPTIEATRFMLARKPKTDNSNKRIAALRGAIKQSKV
jgi:hypothetical protein